MPRRASAWLAPSWLVVVTLLTLMMTYFFRFSSA